ncbi:MAG: hypothetical protein H6822_03890 [Planctomycetaceae bacterium]|nr:hypothetical protein [Planctomycetales bacterium]MCB9921298.1 hypothetical protein [Planctomycetaceae bacterium]
MLSPGEIISAKVTEVQPFGVFFTYDGDEIVVLIPEIGWIPTVSDCREFTKIGMTHSIKIIRQADNGQYVASIREAAPHRNPWKDESIQEGQLREGRVTRTIHNENGLQSPFGYVIEILPGVSGVLVRNQLDGDLDEGDMIRVKIARLDRDTQLLELTAS